MGFEAQRTKVWAERWWELEPEMRVALHRSAERRGGQLVHKFYRFRARKRKPSFELYMRQSVDVVGPYLLADEADIMSFSEEVEISEIRQRFSLDTEG
jgi:hypothetical protein